MQKPTSKSPIIYLFPGLGTDHRLFWEYNFAPFEWKAIEWAPFEKANSMEGYAKKLIPQIDQTRPIILLGVSMGGMIAQELSHLVKTEVLILVSTIRKESERPWIMRFAERFPLYRIMNPLLLWFIANTAWLAVGVWKKEHRKILKDMILKTTANGMIKQTELSVQWHPKELKTAVFHVHGDKDPLFPIKKQNPDHVIKGGNHQMMYKHRVKIEKAIVDWLKTRFSH